MYPVFFEGATEIKKPVDMTDEQCTSIWAKYGFETLLTIFANKGKAALPPGVFPSVDEDGFVYFLTAWMPNKEDREALMAGKPIFIKTLSKGLPPMAVFTVDCEDNILHEPERDPNRYYLFTWPIYEACGGMHDLYGSYSSLDQALSVDWSDKGERAEIYDMFTGRAVFFHEGEEWRAPDDARNSYRVIYADAGASDREFGVLRKMTIEAVDDEQEIIAAEWLESVGFNRIDDEPYRISGSGDTLLYRQVYSIQVGNGLWLQWCIDANQKGYCELSPETGRGFEPHNNISTKSSLNALYYTLTGYNLTRKRAKKGGENG